MLYVNASDVPWIAAMRPMTLGALGGLTLGSGADVYSAPSAGSSSSPYRFAGYEQWKDPDGYPAIKPPWGTLSAIDLNTGEYQWRIPLGEFPALTGRGLA